MRGRGFGRARLWEGEAPAEPYDPTPTLHSARQEPRPPQESKRLTAIQLPAIQLHGHQAEHDHAALAELAVWCEQFSPIVGLEESDSPACLLLDVTGLGPLFGTEYHLAELIVCAFGRRGYQVRVGVADTVGAAWALARYGTSNRGQASFVPGSIPEQTHKSSEAFSFVLRERESFVRWPSKAVDCATCRLSTALEGHRTENLCVRS